MPNSNPQQTTPQQQIAKAAEGANRAAERLEQGAETVTNAAIEKVRQVREEAQSGIEQQRDQIANRFRRVGGVLRSSSQTLSTDDPLSQQLFDSAGVQIERVADYIANITPGDLASDVQSLARRRPGLFFGGSFILGLALGRFAKSTSAALAAANLSEEDEYQQTLAVQRRDAPRKRTIRTPPTRSASQYGNISSGSLPQGVSSSVSATVGTGSAHSPAPNAAPSYGASTAARPVPDSTVATSTTKAHSVEPGEGSKS